MQTQLNFLFSGTLFCKRFFQFSYSIAALQERRGVKKKKKRKKKSRLQNVPDFLLHLQIFRIIYILGKQPK